MRDEELTSGTRRAAESLPAVVISPERCAEVEILLNAMRRWVIEVEGGTMAELPQGSNGAHLQPPDLHSVIAEVSAMRNEVRLEARVAKASRERMDSARESFEKGLELANESLREVADDMEHGMRQALDPLLKERDRLRDDLQRSREEPLGAGIEALLDAVETLERGLQVTEKTRRSLRWRARFLPSALFGGILEGYEMAARRVKRSLENLGLCEIEALGERFDPTRMRSVETEVRDDAPAGHVLEVLRPGWIRGDRVLRFAEVRISVQLKNGVDDGKVREEGL